MLNNNNFKALLSFLIKLIKPSLAKVISVPLLMTGIGILNSPLWLDLANSFLLNQEYYPNIKGPILPPKDYIGWIFIALSIFIYLVDTLRLYKSDSKIGSDVIADALKDNSKQTADLVAMRIKELPLSVAPHVVDEPINKLIEELRKLRFFPSFPTREKAIQLANKLIDGELSGGSPAIKAQGLALSARCLSLGDDVTLAKEYLKLSKNLDLVPDAKIAEAFIESTESGVTEAITMLASEDSATMYSAIFMLKRKAEDLNEAINWFDSSGLTIIDLDIDGQTSYVATLLHMQNWETALNAVNALEDITIESSPALTQLAAFTFLANAIKVVELRKSVFLEVPIASTTFPLADDAESLKLRNKAIALFKTCTQLLNDFGLSGDADKMSSYALWLELRNPETYETAKKELLHYFSDYSIKAFEYLPLAHAFGIELDYEKVEEELNRQTALCNDTNPVLGVARFVLVQTQKNFSDVIDYINIHRQQLEKFVNPISLSMIEIECLAKAGLTSEASALLSKIEGANSDPEEINNLKGIIATVNGDDPIALSIKQYETTNKTSDLGQLVNLLEKSQPMDKYLFYFDELFQRTGTEVDALKIANARSALGKFSELHDFLEEIQDLVDRSELLQFHWAWSLFRKGDLAGARDKLLNLKGSNSHNLDLATLEVNLSIYSGNWDSLTVLVENNWEKRDELDAAQLLDTAKLAQAQSPGRAKQILEYTTKRYPDAPEVLASAYFTATTMGWEDNQNTADWINKAALLSNEEDGPLHSASLEELKEIINAQQEQNNKIYNAYNDGTAPVFTVAELLNKTLSDFYLLQPLENLKATDIRTKSVIAAFHSIRQERLIIEGKLISLDASSTLILGFIDLLDSLFDTYEKIIIPHSLMRWLYEEKQKIAFHQPSQVLKAIEFERLVSDKFINVITPQSIENPELAVNVGDDLASLLEEAKQTYNADKQVLVVCSYPVFKNGSYRDQEVDLSEYKYNLTSCIALVNKLKEVAVLTDSEYEKASKYLLQHDSEWPYEIEIEDHATIFLDSLSITYLMIVGVLDKFKETQLTVFVHKNEVSAYQQLRRFSSSIRNADELIGKIRSQFSTGISSGKVILSEMKKPIFEKESKRNNKVYPTEELIQASDKSDGALIDDRFLNQHNHITIDKKTIPIYTTLDLIETLCVNKTITQDTKYSYRAKLREAGFGIVPITIDELNFHLSKSKIINGILIPTKELRLIKEGLSLLKITRLVKFPRDIQWLHETVRSITSSLKQQWSNDVESQVSRAKSNWLYELIDFRGWAHCFEVRTEEGIAYTGETLRANSVLIPPDDLSEDMKGQYNKWLDDCVLLTLKGNDYICFQSLIESIKGQVKPISEKLFLGVDSNE